MPPDSILVPELPPRARRILQRAGQVSVGGGTTSACAENTFIELAIAGYIRNYLRVRGEYFTAFTQSGSCRELPPRARRIHPVDHDRIFLRGTTSACAENTSVNVMYDFPWGNYLRVRGEYGSGVATVGCMMELPPRARRIQPFDSIEGFLRGTTSACAENTAGHDQPRPNTRNYLRVRGEY